MTKQEFLIAHYHLIAAQTEANAVKCPGNAKTLNAHAKLMREFASDISGADVDDAHIVDALVKACHAAQAIGVP